MKSSRSPGRPRKSEASVAATAVDDEIAGAEEVPEHRALTTQETALKLGMSVPWVKLHASELQGRLTRKGYRFPPDLTIERVRETVTLRSQRGQAVRTAEQGEGELARKVFDRLDHGVATREIVKELGITPEKVRQLAQEWIKCGRFDEDVLDVVHGRREPPRPASPPQGSVQPVVIPGMDSPPSPAPSGMPSLEIPAMPHVEEKPAGRLGLAETMRRNAQAQIAAGDAKLEELRRRIQSGDTAPP